MSFEFTIIWQMLSDIGIVISGYATLVLVIITFLYLLETKKIREEAEKSRMMFEADAEKSRIETKKPIFSFQSDEIPSCPGKTLYLCNYGPIARNVSINIITSSQKSSKIFLYTLSQNERIGIVGDWCGIKEAKGRISVEISCFDSDMRPCTPPPMSIDYNDISNGETIAIPVLQPIRVDCYKMGM